MTEPILTITLITLVILSATKLILKVFSRIDRSNCSPWGFNAEFNKHSDDGVDLP